MTVRTAELRDVEEWMALVELVRAHFPGLDLPAYRAQLEAAIGRKEALVARDGGRLAGALALSPEEREILFLAVHPEARRKGAATALLTAAMERFAPGTAVSVTTYREGDPLGVEARALYRRFGFVSLEKIDVFDYPCEVLEYRVPGGKEPL